jgi:hypothetical protein
VMPGRSYTLEALDRLDTGEWFVLARYPVQGTPGTLRYLQTLGNGARYFRLRIVQ